MLTTRSEWGCRGEALGEKVSPTNVSRADGRLGRAIAKRDEAEKAGVDSAKIEAKRQAADRIQGEIKALTSRRDALPRRVMLKEIHEPKRFCR